jgi:hypothetical protein
MLTAMSADGNLTSSVPMSARNILGPLRKSGVNWPEPAIFTKRAAPKARRLCRGCSDLPWTRSAAYQSASHKQAETGVQQSSRPSPAAKPLRILEVGNHTFFAKAVPDQTDFYYAGHRTSHRLKPLGPLRFLQVLRRLRRKQYDLVVLHSARFAPWHPRTFLPLLRNKHFLSYPWLCAPCGWRLLHRFHDVPVVAIDLSDTFGIGRHNFHLLDRCRAFYKRELPADRWQVFFKSGHWDLPGRRWRQKRRNQRRLDKLRPISLGSGHRPLPERSHAAKTTDVFFAGDLFRGTTPRADGFAELKALEAEGYHIDLPEHRLPYREYVERLAKAWLAWSPSGYGWECVRHVEAAAVGTVVLANYPTILRDMPFRDGEHCLLYSPDPGELAAAVRHALRDKQRLERIADAAYQHFRRHHTDLARAERVAVAVLGRRLDGTPAAAGSRIVEDAA